MKGRNATWLSLPLRLPWWGSVLVATIVYCGLKYGIPELQTVTPALQPLAKAAPSFAPILAIPWLLLAAKQLYDTDGQSPPQEDQEPPK